MASLINMAMSGLVRRAEQSEAQLLVDTFVDTGMIGSMLLSYDHQVIYGRRGTGKTHALTYLSKSVSNKENLSIYIDLRTIGSNGSIYNDESLPISERVSRLLIDVSNEIHDKLQTTVMNPGLLDSNEKFTIATGHLSSFAAALDSTKITGEISSETEAGDTRNRNSSSGLKIAAGKDPLIEYSNTNSNTSEEKTLEKTAKKGMMYANVHFGATHKPISSLLELLDKRLYIILDEWSAIPEELQPYLADMLKRSYMTVRQISVKIAAIEQRSNFLLNISGKNYLGLELGADISADVNLDDFMVFDNDAAKAAGFFSNLFYKHLKTENPELNILNSADFIRKAFTQSNAFDELVKAAEGVPRDAINIAMMAAQAADGDQISIPIIRNAARRWYQRDKEQTISANSKAESILRHIIDEIIGQRKARAFLVPQSSAKTNPLLAFLYDSRVLHILKRSSSAKDQPGKRFTVFKIDYGCYVELLNTSNAPKGLFDTGDESESFIEVPQDDYRSIRRAVLNIDEFEKLVLRD
ncbi:hypothetical protein [Deinococcus sp. LM3]|uniref:ORC-CDC6 family AAA ATPase n=1 Tax=Deinococcus sp. LM3 TaxID=1938608 RepID=UPI0009CE2B37|nr:hypothetical protein [Deinococcus sp. LM3]OOV15788.1 hypothetical protein BXU09_03555 [Deinococcus sp. LM3]